MTTPNHTLDARLARAMHFTLRDGTFLYNADGTYKTAICCWSPSSDENHFAEVMREIERREAQGWYCGRLLVKLDCTQLPEVGCVFAPIHIRCLAAAETLEGANG